MARDSGLSKPTVSLGLTALLEAGLGREVRNFGFLSVGAGVGMGLVLDGRLYRGAGGAAGEVGYLPVGADPYDRQVRRRGAFEESVNAEAVVRRAASALGQDAILQGAVATALAVAQSRLFDPATMLDRRELLV